ncbi:MAG: DUF4031 domain-containing protein [Nocardioidaceae bacterium]|nr:DUF4031 domain-containing protein [Nocardioidaceae bacterium]
MALWIDPPVWPAHGRLWSHLISDTSLAELHTFAAAQGVPRRGFERDHYDVPASSYDALVSAGATPVSAREVVRSLTASGLRKRKAVAMAARAPGRELLRPPRLRPGDQVAVVTTAGPVLPARLAAGVARLEGWGLRVQIGEHVLDRHPRLVHLAGLDVDQASDLSAAWMDPSVRGVFAARGGFGTQRVLDLLDWRRLAEAEPKVLIGFSDLTVLHQAVAARLGLASVHGPVVSSLGEATDDGAERLRRLLFEPEAVVDLLAGIESTTWVSGRAEGILVGGNLAMLTAELGTAFDRPASNGVVVIEDIAEAPHRIDRQLTQLQRNGWFDDARAVVLGSFTDCGDPAQVDAVLLERLSPLGVPIVAGVDLGHTRSSISIPLGVLATLDADARTLTLACPALR